MSAESSRLNIAVLLKQVPASTALSVNPKTRQLEVGSERVVNTYDFYGIGTAIGLKERCGATVTVISAGPPTVREVLLRALATGADEAVLLDLPDHNEIETLQTAKLLADEILKRAFDLVIAGQSTEDIETGQVGLQVAELLSWPHISLVTHVDLEDGELRVRRDSEGTKEVLGVLPPAVLLVLTGRDAEQRHPTLRGMMAARKKQIDVVSDPGQNPVPSTTWTEPTLMERDASGVIVQDQPAPSAASQLVAWLREQKVI